MISIEILAKTRLFSGVGYDELKLIQPMLSNCRFEKGQTIIKEDTFGDVMYLLCEGTVLVTKELVKGIEGVESKEKVLATLKSDYYPTFGENGLLGHGARTANVIAQTDCVLCTLTRSDFVSFANSHIDSACKIFQNIASILSERLHDTDNNLVKLATAFYIAVQR